MEVVGVGWATLISRVCMLGIFIYLLHKQSLKNLQSEKYFSNLFRFEKYNPIFIRKILTLGLPIAFQLLFEVSAFSLSGLLMVIVKIPFSNVVSKVA